MLGPPNLGAPLLSRYPKSQMPFFPLDLTQRLRVSDHETPRRNRNLTNTIPCRSEMRLLPFPFLTSLLFLLPLSPAQANDAEPNEAGLLTGIRQLTFAGKRAGEGYFSAGGSRMIFQSEREPGNPFFQIYLLDLETGDTQRVSPGHGKTTCAWIHPTENRVLFASTHDDPQARQKQQEELDFRASGQERRYSWDYDETYEIYTHDLDSGATINLTNAPGYDAEGAYSPDGQTIVFASNRAFYQNPESFSKDDRLWQKMNPSFAMDLYAMDADGSNVRRLTDHPGYDGGPFFSADGSKICWRRFNRKGTQAEIFVMNADGTGKTQLTSLGAMSWAPFFHPSGDYLVFATNLHGFGNFELYLVDAAGLHEPVRVTWTDGFDGLAAFSPDGKSLAWTTNRTPDGTSQIFMASWNHEEALHRLDASPLRPATRSEPAPELPETLAPAIAEPDLKAHVDYLASSELQGRLTGTEGERLATAYAAAAFEKWGLRPLDLGENSDGFFQAFEFTAGVELGSQNRLVLEGENDAGPLELDRDWRPVAFSETGAIDPAEIVFVGYGIDIPRGQVEANGSTSDLYTSYYQTDVKDKWVLMLRFGPEGLSGDERRKFRRFASLRYKAVVARKRGARGVIFATGPNSQSQEELVPLSFDASLADSGLAAVSVSTELATNLVARAGKDLAELQKTLDQGEMMIGIPIPDVKASGQIDIVQQKATGRNTIAVLPAGDAPSLDAPPLVIGAHIDHLGNKPNPSSRALGKEQYQIHYGADDNASGTAGLLEIAHYFADLKARGKLPLKRDVVFAAWSGEEMGLLGSSAFVRDLAQTVHGDPDAKLGDVLLANLNMDMIGRLEKTLILQGAGSSTRWASIVEQRNVPVGLPITLQQDVYVSTDATSFYLREVPILSAFTGAHEDYHKPADTPDKIDFANTQRVARFMALVARGLAISNESLDYVKVEQPEGRGERAGLRVYLGTIPDYASSDVEGVKLSGATPGSPAEEAGLQAGDIVIGLAGDDVKNLYDYSYALQGLKVGETVEIQIQRDAETKTLSITPGSRQ